MTLDYNAIEEKWQSRWEENRIFEADPDEREKFFLNIPYPYMNGFLHIGRLYTYLRGEVLSRYKRMKGYNVLFPFAFHCTGSPIVNAARRIADGEEKQIRILKNMGVSEELIGKFADPEYWTEFFPEMTKVHLRQIGATIDWRRSFITTSLNPHYDRFISWQFRKLKEDGFVIKGAHPVIWCSKCQNAVSDHSRLDGEGEIPQEFTLLKFRHGNDFIIAATLRPETVYGQTNLWVDPDETYVRASVNQEVWIVSLQCAQKLADQEKDVHILENIKGIELIGNSAVAPVIKRAIPILPSKFCDPNKGTGIVTSVPSDAPDDWMGLFDLKNDASLREKYGLCIDDVQCIEPIAIIDSKGWGEYPAVEICKKMNIRDQHDREKLTKAKKEIYKSGFYTGVMNKNCGEYSGLKVEEAKDKIKAMMMEEKEADIMFEPSGKVTCRCLTDCTVKIVRDQYFLAYGDPEWKRLAHEALDNMRFYPEVIRKQFDYVVDWLNNWACTRKVGLGTKLPWDENWMIESLSDSTIYMAYYTISHMITKIEPEMIDDSLFDYIFLGKGNPEEISERIGKDLEFTTSMRKEFLYWYPFDIRSSGKDLIQNHLTFCLFNHVAIFPKELWPKGFGVNGWLMIDKEKMSSSKGNVFTADDMHGKYGADVTRFALMYSGEGIDDPNWETNFVETMGDKLEQWYNFALENYGKGNEEVHYIDRWFDSMVLSILKEVNSLYEEMMFRSAIQRGYFDMQRALKWYLKRTSAPNRAVMDRFIEVQTKILSPFCPHVAEEIWEAIGKEGFISTSAWPEPWKEADESMLQSEEHLKSAIDDIREILKVARIENPKNIYIYTTPEWKWKVVKVASEEKEFKTAMPKLMADEEMRSLGKKVSKFLTTAIKDRIFVERVDERGILNEARGFISQETGADIHIDEPYDPENKADNAVPGRVAIYIE
ncbi:MAG: leucine--tRNA ligase [Candidatus Methanofastidiosa archaeon]|nr:leucine--tRNA ligase [Candidatus Methanofastidiosa archaeon]